MLYDDYMNSLLKENYNLSVPWYLMAAYAYYVEDDPIISDAAYDNLAKTMLKNYDTIEHFHKGLIDKSSLEAGTLLLATYPDRTIGGVRELRNMKMPSIPAVMPKQKEKKEHTLF